MLHPELCAFSCGIEQMGEISQGVTILPQGVMIDLLILFT